MSITENCWKNLRKETIKKYLKDDEVAVPIVGYEEYFVTNFGRVFSSKTKFTFKTVDKVDYACIVWKELKPFYCHQYKCISLSQKGRKGKKNIYLHKLVYEAFYGQYNTYYFKICFRDGNPENCDKDNLALKFRYKSAKKLEQYKKQQQILQILNP